MIRSFKHKGPKTFDRDGSTKGIQPAHAAKLRRILTVLDGASGPDELTPILGLNPHPLKGALKGHWAVRVSGNWRVTFRFDGPDVTDVDYVDYH